ncbi:hypothetical protein GOODEAATRI_024143, partial [Goodea atripinnis]
ALTLWRPDWTRISLTSTPISFFMTCVLRRIKALLFSGWDAAGRTDAWQYSKICFCCLMNCQCHTLHCHASVLPAASQPENNAFMRRRTHVIKKEMGVEVSEMRVQSGRHNLCSRGETPEERETGWGAGTSSPAWTTNTVTWNISL